MIFLFEEHPEKLVNLEKLKEEDEKDTNRRQLNLRKECRNQLQQMKRTVKNSPIFLSGDNSIDYKIVSQFMNTKSKKVEVDRSLVENLQREQQGEEINRDAIIDGNEEGEDVTVYVRCSNSVYSGIQSALSFLYRQSGFERPAELKNGVSLYCKGSKRLGAELKQKLALKIVEGKKPMSKAVYSFLAKKMFESEKKEYIFAHLFLVLDWNLMKRSENCVNLKIQHIWFDNDALVIEFAKSKGHQGGEEHVGPWHIYANPLEPWKFPVLSLGRYLLKFSDSIKSNGSLFGGRSQYERYSKLFLKLIDEHDDELCQLGIEKGDLGTHSCRKGMATMVAFRSTVSPPIVSLYISAGWVMGGVKEKYLKYKAAGDQFVGKCATGINQLCKTFSVYKKGDSVAW
jgi:hypothetical protein